MIKPIHAAFIDGLRLRFFRPEGEDRHPDPPWRSADDLMIIAGLDPDERTEFFRCAAEHLWRDAHKTIAADKGLTVIAMQSHTNINNNRSNAPAIARRYAFVAAADSFWNRKARILIKPQAVVRRHADRFKPDEDVMAYLLGPRGADRVDIMAFLPGEPEIVVQDEIAKLNLWRPHNCLPQKGSVGPFLRHVEYLLDDNPAVKPAAALLLIGSPGVGKNVFAALAAEAVGLHNVYRRNVTSGG